MLVAALIFVVVIAVGFPIYLALLGSGVYVMMVTLHIPAVAVVTGVYDSLYKTVLVAVPFFILAGIIVEKSSMSRRLSNLMISLVGNIRGGTPIAALLANEFFGAMSGSAPAATAAVGKTMLPIIEKQYNEKLAVGLLASAGGLAIIMPPSITMILYGSAGNVSVGKMFLAGIVPAILIGIAISGYLIAVCGRRTGPAGVPGRWIAIRDGLPVILLPVIVLGGIYAGVMTPTEAGGIAAAYSLLVAIAYRDFSVGKFIDSLGDTVRLTGQIFILIAASGVFAQAMTMLQIPQMLSNFLSNTSPFSFLLMLNLVFLLLGMLIDPASAVLVMTPLLMPTVLHLGIDQIHFGIVMVVNLAIGMFTPPFGLNLFVAQGVFKKKMEFVVKSCVPFFVCYAVVLVIITYMPGLYMWLPRLL